MPFSLKITRKGFFTKRTIDIGEMLENCKFKFGTYNDFYVLDEGKHQNNSCILYNPQHIGRGIYFDGNDDALVEMSINTPTSQYEIEDFFALAKEICRQYKSFDILNVEDNKKFSLEELLGIKDDFIKFNYDELQRGIEKSGFGERAWIMTATMWPIWIDKKMCNELRESKDLSVFSQLLHDKQNMDTYYAKPSLMRNEVDNSILAIYTLTEDCLSIFPMDFNDFISASNPQNPIRADKGMIRFFIFSENRPLDGMWDYEEFIKYVMERGATKYDDAHILVPEYNKAGIEEMTNSILRHA